MASDLPIALTECASPQKGVCGIEDTCLARESWDPVSRAVETALRNLPLSSIAPFRAGEREPAEAPVIQIGAHVP